MSDKNKILIVDDDPIARENLEDLLIEEGYALTFAANGEEALAKASEFGPDLLLLDVMMPGMNGFEVCRRLRADPATAELPIILITALNDRESRLQGIEVGADDFISKPFDTVELRARVRAITRLNRYRRLLVERTKFERVVENAETGYLLLDDQDKIRFANPRARLYLNLPEDSDLPITAPFLALAREQYRCEPEEAWQTWLKQSSERTRYLVRSESTTAQPFWLQVNVLDYLPLGSEPTWIVSLTDITAKMITQRGIRKFHAIVAHKLRTPINSILGSLELIAMDVMDLPRDEIADLSDMALTGARNLHRNLEGVIQYTNTPLVVQPGSGINLSQIPSLVNRICEELDILSVSISKPEDMEDVQLTMSAEGLELILWELLENAEKFHPQQQPFVEVFITCPAETELIIRVSDNGVTLSPKQLIHIWTPYYQGEKFFTGQIEGLGLGLPMVANMVWSANGRCRIFNRATRNGVTVELVLPLVRSSLTIDN